MGELLDQHPAMAITRPPELRFLTDSGGLIDTVRSTEPQPPAVVVRARTAALRARARLHGRRYNQVAGGPADLFARQLRTRWYRRVAPTGEVRGLSRELTREQVEAAARAFPRAYRRDRMTAARGLLHDLVDPMATRRGKACWVDTTPHNTRSADGLHEIYPRLRVVNMIRDGRDVAESITHRSWGPNDMDAALVLWRDLMLAGQVALSHLPGDQVLTIQLEDLIARDRQATYERLLKFLGLDDEDAMHDWFDAHLDAGRGSVGSWQRDRDAAEIERIQQRYQQLLGSLREQGVVVPS